MRKILMSQIIKTWDWLIIDFEGVLLSLSSGGLSLQTQLIPVL
jgi:hypothetical protein